MEKVCVRRLTQCGVPNANNVVYSEEVLNKAIKKAFENGPIIVEDNKDQHLFPNSSIGFIKSFSNILNDKIFVTPCSEDAAKKIKEYIESDYRLEMHYIGKLLNIDPNGIKYVDISKIISYSFVPSYLGRVTLDQGK